MSAKRAASPPAAGQGLRPPRAAHAHAQGPSGPALAACSAAPRGRSTAEWKRPLSAPGLRNGTARPALPSLSSAPQTTELLLCAGCLRAGS